jgi:hypothetical protein
VGGKGWGGGEGGEMTQTLYAPMNKIKIFKNAYKKKRNFACGAKEHCSITQKFH